MWWTLQTRRILRGQAVASNDDLEQLLCTTWTTRIWTYQEVVFAAYPVLISGMSHLPWTDFVQAFVVLNTCTIFPSMGRWTEIIQSRERYRRALAADCSLNLETQYRVVADFGSGSPWVILVPIALLLALIIFVIDLGAAAEALVRREPMSDFDRLLFAVTELLLSITALCSDAFFILEWQAPNPAWSSLERAALPGTLSNTLYTTCPSKFLLNALCWRACSERRDIIYANLPMIEFTFGWQPFRADYSVEVAQLNTESAELFLERRNTDILALAANARCPGAASWVPEFPETSHPILGSGRAVDSPRCDPSWCLMDNHDRKLRIRFVQRTWKLERRFIIRAVSDFVDP